METVGTAQATIARLKDLHTISPKAWKKTGRHKKTGVQVFIGKINGQKVFKGVGSVAVKKEDVFDVIGRREEWDEWYESGNLVENIDDQTSLTYMVMKGHFGTSTRDLSLVERVEVAEDGSIFFGSTSIESSQIPKVSGRVRAILSLNGWILEDHWIPSDLEPVHHTKMTYYLCVDVKTVLPNMITTKFMSRRPLCIARVINYFDRHRSSSAELTYDFDDEERGDEERSIDYHSYGHSLSLDLGQSSSISQKESLEREMTSGGSTESRKRRHSTKEMSESPKSLEDVHKVAPLALSPLVKAPEAIIPPTEFTNLTILPSGAVSSADQDVKQSLVRFKKALIDGEWKKEFDDLGFAVWTKDVDELAQRKIPLMRGEAVVTNDEEEVTTENVLGTILSQAAKRVWDESWVSTAMVKEKEDDGHLHSEIWKGVSPFIDNQHLYLCRGIDREMPNGGNGVIDLVSTTVHSNRTGTSPLGGEVNFSGFRLEPLSKRSVHVIHASDLVVSDSDEIPDTIIRSICISVAHRPQSLSKCIATYGFAPHFLKWEVGAWNVVDDGGSMEDGEIWFHVQKMEGSDVKEQKCWLKWSQKMYPKGINVVTNSKDSISQVSFVKDMSRTIQLTWKSKSSEMDARLVISPSKAQKGQSSSFATFNGKIIYGLVENASGMDRIKEGGSKLTKKHSDRQNSSSAGTGSLQVSLDQQPSQIRSLNGTYDLIHSTMDE